MAEKSPYIFISYSTARAGEVAAMLGRELVDAFGDCVFLDQDGIKKGAKFAEKLERGLDRATCMLVLIDSGWHERFSESGRKHRGDSRDWVRYEVEGAISRDLVVIPVELARNALPAPEQLPESMRTICERNAAYLGTESWDTTVWALIEFLAKHPELSLKRRGSKRKLLLLAGALLCLVPLVYLMYWNGSNRLPVEIELAGIELGETSYVSSRPLQVSGNVLNAQGDELAISPDESTSADPFECEISEDGHFEAVIPLAPNVGQEILLTTEGVASPRKVVVVHDDIRPDIEWTSEWADPRNPTREPSVAEVVTVEEENLASVTRRDQPLQPGSSDRWHMDVPLEPGANQITVLAMDKAGNETTRTVTLWRECAKITLVDIPAGETQYVSKLPWRLSGVIQNAASPTLSISSDKVQDVDLKEDGRFKTPVSLTPDEAQVVELTADGMVPVRIDVVHDGLQPEIRWILPPANLDGPVRDAEIEVRVDVQDTNPVEVTCNSQELEPGADGQWHGRLAIEEGSNSLSVSAKDAAGNEARSERTVERDSEGPELVRVDPPTGSSLLWNKTRPITLVFSERVRDVRFNGEPLDLTDDCLGSAGRITPPGREDKWPVEWVAHDEHGNESCGSLSWMIVEDWGDARPELVDSFKPHLRPGKENWIQDGEYTFPAEILHEETGLLLVYVSSAPGSAESFGFYIGKTEVSRRQWARGDDPVGLLQRIDHPIVAVDWKDVDEWCTKNDMELPTERQWEWAAQGPGSWDYPWGPTWIDDKCNAHPPLDSVDEWPQSASWCGAINMLGNVWEWCSDDKPDEQEDSKRRRIRGGAVDMEHQMKEGSQRGTHLGRTIAGEGMDLIGFRPLVRVR